MSTHKHIDLICIAVMICAILLTALFMNGESLGIQALADERVQARKDKNWKRSDELRDQLKALGYTVEDTKEGQKVRKTV